MSLKEKVRKGSKILNAHNDEDVKGVQVLVERTERTLNSQS